MKFVRASTGKEIPTSDVFPDDRVSTAASKLQVVLGEPVYLWTRRRVSVYEAVGMIAEDSGWEKTVEDILGSEAQKSVKKLFGISLKPPRSVDRLWLVGALKGKELFETVSCSFRYLTVGGYFADHGIDPYRAIPQTFSEKTHGLVDTSQIILETFQVDVIYVATRRDLESLRPTNADIQAWTKVLERYRFDQVSTQDHSSENFRYTELMEQPKSIAVSEKTLTYIKVSGTRMYVKPGIDALMTAFATFETSEEMPMLRLGNHSLGTVLTRLHDSFVGSPELDRYIVSSKKNFLQVLIRIPETSSYALLELFPDKYYLSARFSQREETSTDVFVRVFDITNKFLTDVSPYFIPVTPDVLKSGYVSSSVKLSEYRPSLVDMWYSVVLVSQKKICDIRSFYNAAVDGGPILKPVNVSQDEKKAFLQFVRSANVSKEALVRNFLYHNSGASGPVLIRRIVTDYGLSSEDASDMVREFEEFTRFAVPQITTVRVDKQSASRVVLRMEFLQDERYVDRIANAVSILFDECGRGIGSKKRVVASIDVIKTISDKVQSKIGDIDEFMDLVNISEPGMGHDESVSEEFEVGESGMGSDILRALQQRDPAVFGFKATGVFRPYSVQCQDRQPVVLTEDELQSAIKGSTDGSFKGSITYGSNRQFNYICPRKWCVTSKVARKQGESCPLRDEPEYDFGDMTYPGYITGSKHPKGLCMPCCFKKEPVPGSKVYERRAACEGLGETAQDQVAVNHLSRSDRILDDGVFGKVPDSLKSHVPEGVVRRGMGSNTNIFDAIEYVFQNRDFLNEFRTNMLYHQFLTGTPREIAKRSESDANFAKWWRSTESANYRTIFGLRTALSQKQEAREKVAFSMFDGVKVSRDDPHDAWVRPINSYTPTSNPHVMIISDYGASAAVSVDEIRGDRQNVAIILHRDGRYEPLGYIHNKTFSFVFPATQPWIRRLLESQKPIMEHTKAKRVVSTNFSVVALLFPNNTFLAMSRPIPINLKYPHIHLSDVPASAKVGHKEAKSMLSSTKDPFYRSDYIDVSEALLKDADTDLQLYIREKVNDRRFDVLKDVKAKSEAEGKYAKAIWDVIGDDPLINSSHKSTASRIVQLRKRYASKLPSIPVYILDYIIERLLRPVGIATIPVINKTDDEVIISQTK